MSTPGTTAKTLRVTVGLSLLGLAGLVIWERNTWLQEMRSQCDSARPLVATHATRQRVLEVIGTPSSEHDASSVAELTHEFASTPPKRESLARHLQGPNTLLLYSRSNSIMFLYLDGQGEAFKADCFLQ